MGRRPVAAEDRFWSKVDKSGGPDACWTWTAARNRNGYGQFWQGRNGIVVHRFSWMMHNGPIPVGLFCCHHCDNPPCVNPAHLFIGTNSDNMRDAQRKGRKYAHSPEVRMAIRHLREFGCEVSLIAEAARVSIATVEAVLSGRLA